MFRLLAVSILAGLICGAGPAAAADRTVADAYLAGVPALVSAGDYKTIEDLCKRSLQSDETCPNAHFYLALCMEKSGKARDAFKEYQSAAAFAAKEKDTGMANKASAAAKKLGAGLMEIDALDQKLIEKLQKLALDAFDLGQLETARQAYASLLILQPTNAKAKEQLEKITKTLKERPNPTKTKIAAAMLAEIWYDVGTGKKSEASDLARTLSQKYAETEWGKEAAVLLDRDFEAPKKDEVAQLQKQLKEQNAAPQDPTKTAVQAGNPASSVGVKPAGKPPVMDVDALEKAADDETKKLAKDALPAAFDDAYQKGKGFYAKATPGSEGNQENLTRALEQFIKAETLFARIETENLKTDEMSENAKEASMLRYACMKMTILAH